MGVGTSQGKNMSFWTKTIHIQDNDKRVSKVNCDMLLWHKDVSPSFTYSFYGENQLTFFLAGKVAST